MKKNEYFVGSERRDPTCIQRVSNLRSDKTLRMHVLDETGERHGDRIEPARAIGGAMLDTMYEHLAKMNGVSEDEARHICAGCSMQIIVLMIDQLMTQAHYQSQEALGYLELFGEYLSVLYTNIHHDMATHQRAQDHGHTSINDEIINMIVAAIFSDPRR